MPEDLKLMKTPGGWRFITAACIAQAALPAAPSPRTEASAVTPVDATWHAAWHGKIAAKRAEGRGDFDLLLIGDSILDLWPTKGKASYGAFAPWKPLNLGISGESTEHVLHRLLHGQLDGLKPRVAVVMIGTNNLGHREDERPEWAAAGVRRIVETVRTRLPETRILLLAILPRGGNRGADGIRPNSRPTDLIRRRVDETNRIKIGRAHV